MSDLHPPPSPDQLFDDYWRRRDAGESVDFEALCHAHPAAAAALRRHEAEHRLLDRLLPGPLDAADRAPAADARAADDEATVDLESDDDGFEAGTAIELLERLRGQHGRRYEVLREIGRGGMGIVLRVRDTELRRKLAMKVALAHGDKKGTSTQKTDTRALSRFLEEAQITSQIDHPGIVPVHEIGIDPDGRVFFTMKLVRGENLRTIFAYAHDGIAGWNPVRAVLVLQKVCEAMSYAHGKKVIHRDLKPANVMVGRFGEVYVMDWGLARVLGREDVHDLRLRPAAGSASRIDTDREDERDSEPDSPLVTMDGDVVGTPAYMAPEQAKGQLDRLGPHSDVYSVGAMLYHLISGEVPYVPTSARVSTRTLLARVLDGPPKSLHGYGRKAPAALVAICEKAMARAIEDRYPSMQALGDDLRAYVEGRVVSAYETGSWAETRLWVRRNRGLAAALVAVILTLILGGIVGGEAVAAERRLESANETLLVLAALNSLRQYGNDPDAVAHGTPGGPAYRTWLARAQPLVAKLPALRERLAELRPQSLVTPDELRAASFRYERADELAMKRDERLWRDRFLGHVEWPTADETEVALAAYPRPTDPLAWNAEVFRMVRPDRARIVGQEQLALRLAEELVRKSVGTATWHPRFRDTLAFARYRVGDCDGAVIQQQRVVDEYRVGDFDRASAEDRAVWTRDFGGNLRLLIGLREDRRSGHEQWLRDELDAEIRAMESEIHVQATLSHGGEAAVWYEKLARAVDELTELESRFRAANEAAHDPRWRQAIDAIQRHPLYAGLEITPQLDLLPLEPDPESSLWEFAHLASGTPVQRGNDGALVRRPESGIVFVLLPSGQSTAPGPGPRNARLPARTGHVNAFFLSKYELTQHQRLRLDGRWPGRMWSTRRDMRSPAIGLNFHDAAFAVRHLGGYLRLPTEFEWYYGAHGEAAFWWTTLSQEDLLAHAAIDYELADINTLSPNRFGLHHVFGSASEWCEDVGDYGENPTPPGPAALGGGYDGYKAFQEHQSWRGYPNGGVLLGMSSAGIRPARTLCR